MGSPYVASLGGVARNPKSKSANAKAPLSSNLTFAAEYLSALGGQEMQVRGTEGR